MLFACCQENVFSIERFQRSAEQGTGRVTINSTRRGSRGKTTTTPDFMWNITWLDFFKVCIILLFDEFKLFSLFPSYRRRGFFITSNLIHLTKSQRFAADLKLASLFSFVSPFQFFVKKLKLILTNGLCICVDHLQFVEVGAEADLVLTETSLLFKYRTYF